MDNSNNRQIEDNLACMKALIREKGIDAYIISGSDNHCSECPSMHWRTRQWLSGFSGSSGVIILTQGLCGLWTDYRYWIQAGMQLEGSGVELFCVGSNNVPEPLEWLIQNLPSGSLVALDGRTFTLQQLLVWEKDMERRNIRMMWDVDLVADCWKDRPAPPAGLYREIDVQSAGESRKQKIERLKRHLAEKEADTWVGMSLDGVAWLLNVRARNPAFTPVGEGYFVISKRNLAWYTCLKCVPEDVRRGIEGDGIRIYPYEMFMDALTKIPSDCTALLDPEVTSYAIARKLSCRIINHPDPVLNMKACKNRVELDNIRQAMRKDGAALVQFIYELHKSLDRGVRISEVDAARMLTGKRKAMPGYISDSFATIAAWGGGAALAHYEPREDVFLNSRDKRMFLIDSGGQWMEGTTDVTRTIAPGETTEQQRRYYTLVLKGHLALASARFPEGTRGYQLDSLARQFLWEEGLDYGHGTGHGVGYILSVHEGPQNISSRPVDVPLRPGMITSNEPGLYSRDEFGIRIENLVFCREDGVLPGFQCFDTLTLAPYCRSLIDVALLDVREREQINGYHARVMAELEGFLNKEERQWLERETGALDC